MSGILLGLIVGMAPGVIAYISYTRWQDGAADRPMAAWIVGGVCLPFFALILFYFVI